MPGKKRPKASSTAGPVMVILEEIRSQNRATIETVEARHQETRRDLEDFRTEVRGQFRVVHDVLRAHGEDIGQLKTGLGEVGSGLAEVRSEVAEVRTTLAQVTTDLGEVRSEVAALKANVSRLDAVITADYRERLQRLEQRVEALSADKRQ